MEEQKSNTWPRYAVYSLIIIIILLLFLILILYLLKSPLIYRSSAYSTTPSVQSGPAPTLSLDNSYIFASPLRAKAGDEKIRVTVFILDSRGLGISGKSVSIGSGSALTVAPIQPLTDGQGRATFDVSSGSIGVYVIEASVDGTKLTQTASISFD